VVGRFASIITATKAPYAAGAILATGVLSVLNKVSPEEQRAVIDLGLQPKVRPVNCGTQLFKTIAKGVKSSKDGKRAAKNLMPIQHGLGTSSGMTKLSIGASAAYAAGKVIVSDDATNGFNALKRKSIGQALEVRWPSAVGFFDSFYAIRAPVAFSFHDDADDTWCLKFEWSTEGTRQGCVLGSLFFDIAVDHFIYSPLSRQFEEEVHHSAATDDLFGIWSPPADLNDSQAWEAFYDRIAVYLAAKEELSTPHGILSNKDKLRILIPPGAPLPLNPTRFNGVVLKVVQDGILIAGIPIGTAEFVDLFLRNRLVLLSHRLLALEELAKLDPQAYLRLLGTAVNKGFDYLVTCTATDGHRHLLEIFDQEIWGSLCRVLCPNSAPSASRLKVMEGIARLKLAHGGFDLLPLEVKAAFAYLTGLLASANTELLAEYGAFLLPSIEAAYSDIRASLGLSDHIPAGHGLLSVLPPTPADLIKEFVCKRAPPIIPTPKAMKLLMTIYGNFRKLAVRNQAISEDVTEEDSIHLLSITSHSQSTRVVSADLAVPALRVLPTDFLCWTRFHLACPQDFPSELPSVTPPGSDYAAMTCLITHKDRGPDYVDLHGSHASWCPSAMKGRYLLHRLLNYAISDSLAEGGYLSQREPATLPMIAQLGLSAAVCSTLFSPKTKKNVIQQFSANLTEVEDAPARSKMSLLQAAFSNVPPLPANTHKNEGSTRCDSRAIAIDLTGVSYIIDGTAPSGLRKDKRTKMVKYFRTMVLRELQNFHRNLPTPHTLTSTPIIIDSVKVKHRKYALLKRLIDLQSSLGYPTRRCKVIAACCCLSPW
jgi:hypothetical protein